MRRRADKKSPHPGEGAGLVSGGAVSFESERLCPPDSVGRHLPRGARQGSFAISVGTSPRWSFATHWPLEATDPRATSSLQATKQSGTHDREERYRVFSAVTTSKDCTRRRCFVLARSALHRKALARAVERDSQRQVCSDWSRRALPGRLTLIAMKRPMETVIGAGLCDGCTGYSEHRVP